MNKKTAIILLMLLRNPRVIALILSALTFMGLQLHPEVLNEVINIVIPIINVLAENI
jgi:hypothetical protein